MPISMPNPCAKGTTTGRTSPRSARWPEIGAASASPVRARIALRANASARPKPPAWRTLKAAVASRDPSSATTTRASGNARASAPRVAPRRSASSRAVTMTIGRGRRLWCRPRDSNVSPRRSDARGRGAHHGNGVEDRGPGRRRRRRGRHRRDPRVDEDGDARRGRGLRHGRRDPLRGGAGGQRGRSAPRARVVPDQLAGGRLVIDAPAPDVARLTIANPLKRNALDQAILDAIARAVRGLEARCLVLTGSVGMFSAGYDIGDIPPEVFAEEAERLVAHPFAEAIDALER